MYTQHRPRRTSSGSAQRRSGHPSSGGRRSSFIRNPRHKRGGFARGGPRRSQGRPQGGGRRFGNFDVSKYINKNPIAHSPEAAYVPVNTFESFNLDPRLIAAIKRVGFESLTPIQDEIIPHILLGKDVVGIANTGTGKTAAFLIPLIQRALKDYKRQVLILTPTRELAIQVEQEMHTLSVGMGMYSGICVGGTNINPQIRNLKKKNHFIIGTPGRILDLIKRGALQPRLVTTVVLDEADRMLDMGFINDIREILKDIPKERDTLCFSATIPPTIAKLIQDFLRDPLTVSVKKADITQRVEQDVVRIGENKFETLATLLKGQDFTRVIIFGAMKHSVERLSRELTAAGLPAESIHGNKSHRDRQRALKSFKDGNVKILVATDVAARGIHVDNVSHVINYDLPMTYEDYVHRIGRTGRGSNFGKALTFVR